MNKGHAMWDVVVTRAVMSVPRPTFLLGVRTAPTLVVAVDAAAVLTGRLFPLHLSYIYNGCLHGVMARPRRSFCGIYSRFGVILFLCSSCLPSFHSGDPPLRYTDPGIKLPPEILSELNSLAVVISSKPARLFGLLPPSS